VSLASIKGKANHNFWTVLVILAVKILVTGNHFSCKSIEFQLLEILSGRGMEVGSNS
jgi:hypothetical protein